MTHAMTTKKKTRAVAVVKTERYTDEVPVEEPAEDEVAVTGEPEQVDLIDELFAEVDASRTMRMYAWCLTEFARNGLRGRRAPGAAYVCDFPFTETDALTYQSNIQARYPTGGMFYIEVRGDFVDKNGMDRNGVIKSWSEQIAGIPGYNQPQQQQQGPYPIIVNTPPPHERQSQQSQPTTQLNPAEMMREHMLLARDMVTMAKDLMPPPQPININGSDRNAAEDKPIEDKLFETVVTKALETDTEGKRLDKVLEALGGRRNSGFDWGGMLEGLTKAILPMAMQFGMQYVQAQRGATISSQPGSDNQQALPAGQPVPVFNVPVDPGERAWFFCVRHLFENCTNGMPARGTANAIIDVLDQYQHLEPVVEPVLKAESGELAIDFLTLVDQRCEQLKQSPAAIAWVAKVQEEARAMSEQGEFVTEEDDNQGRTTISGAC